MAHPNGRQLLLLITLLVSVTAVVGHVPYWERQAIRTGDFGQASDEEDFSFENPFVLPTSVVNKRYSGLNTARAISTVISKDDLFDVIEIRIKKGEPEDVMAASVYVPACTVYEDFRPSVALLGRESEDFPLLSQNVERDLPFAVPEGYGAIIKDMPNMERAVAGTVLLPPGQNFTCFEDDSCDMSFTITEITLSRPGKYYFVVYDPRSFRGRQDFPHDVIVTIGLGEEESKTKFEKNVNTYVAEFGLFDGGIIHTPVCNPVS